MNAGQLEHALDMTECGVELWQYALRQQTLAGIRDQINTLETIYQAAVEGHVIAEGELLRFGIQLPTPSNKKVTFQISLRVE